MPITRWIARWRIARLQRRRLRVAGKLRALKPCIKRLPWDPYLYMSREHLRDEYVDLEWRIWQLRRYAR